LRVERGFQQKKLTKKVGLRQIKGGPLRGYTRKRLDSYGTGRGKNLQRGRGSGGAEAKKESKQNPWQQKAGTMKWAIVKSEKRGGYGQRKG